MYEIPVVVTMGDCLPAPSIPNSLRHLKSRSPNFLSHVSSDVPLQVMAKSSFSSTLKSPFECWEKAWWNTSKSGYAS